MIRFMAEVGPWGVTIYIYIYIYMYIYIYIYICIYIYIYVSSTRMRFHPASIMRTLPAPCDVVQIFEWAAEASIISISGVRRTPTGAHHQHQQGLAKGGCVIGDSRRTLPHYGLRIWDP